MNTLRHAQNWNGDDRTLCGVGDEGTDDANFTDPPVYARSGETVTCTECRTIIQHCRTFVGYKQP